MSKKSKTTSTNDPSAFSKPYISDAANGLKSANDANAGNISNINSLLQNNMGSVLASTLNNPTLGAANTYTNDVLSGKYLNGNPNLQGLIDNTNGDVINRTNAAIGTRGGAGGSAQAQILARELAKNETSLRYNDYATERGYQDKGVNDAATLSGANDSNIQALLQYLGTQATLPTAAAQGYASSVGGLLGQYNTQTQTQTQSPFSSLMQAIGAGTSLASVLIPKSGH